MSLGVIPEPFELRVLLWPQEFISGTWCKSSCLEAVLWEHERKVEKLKA